MEECAQNGKHHPRDSFTSAAFLCIFLISFEAKFLPWEPNKIDFFSPLLCCTVAVTYLCVLPTEFDLQLGEWDHGGRQHEAQPSHPVLLNSLRHIHGSGSAPEDRERLGVCEGEPAQPQPHDATAR